MPPLFSESDLARACTDLLQLDGWRALKTDPVSRREWGKGFGEKGMADYLYIRYRYQTPGSTEIPSAHSWAEIMWIEWKTPRGTVAEKQHAWREKERARGAVALIAGIDFHASVEGFCRWYLQSGLQRKRLRVGGKPSQNLEAQP
jgi:hypothetical protein